MESKVSPILSIMTLICSSVIYTTFDPLLTPVKLRGNWCNICARTITTQGSGCWRNIKMFPHLLFRPSGCKEAIFVLGLLPHAKKSLCEIGKKPLIGRIKSYPNLIRGKSNDFTESNYYVAHKKNKIKPCLIYDNDLEFEFVSHLDLLPSPELFRGRPVDRKLWNEQKKLDGSFTFPPIHHLKMQIFRGGVAPEMRKEVWKYLLGYRGWQESTTEFNKKRVDLSRRYETLKSQWMSIDEDQEERFASFSKRKRLVENDVARTDRSLEFYKGDNNPNLKKLYNILMTYVMYDFDLGYVQGMSDFAAPILFVMENEVDAFWCVVEVMKMVHKNFEKNQAYIELQLKELRNLVTVINLRLAHYLEIHKSDNMYFCYRWVFVWLKREFSFSDTCKLWETLWTGMPCDNFLLLFCVGILDSQANTIIENRFGSNEILKYINDLSMRIRLDDALTYAEAIFQQLSANHDRLPSHISGYFGLGDR